jgi:hypothetical protein
MTLPDVFESREVALLVGMSPIFLNRLVERELHGIKPSLRSEVDTGGRRWFSKEDLFGIGLVFWLFEAGLRAGSGKKRTSVIQKVLDEIVGKGNASANEAAQRLTKLEVPVLAIIQQIYPYRERRKVRKLEVRFMETQELEADDPHLQNLYDVMIQIPVGNLFDRLENLVGHRI